MKASKNTTTYALYTVGYEGCEPSFTFCFTAKNDEEADDKLWRWLRYHSFRKGDAIVKVANAAQAEYVCDNYIPKR